MSILNYETIIKISVFLVGALIGFVFYYELPTRFERYKLSKKIKKIPRYSNNFFERKRYEDLRNEIIRLDRIISKKYK